SSPPQGWLGFPDNFLTSGICWICYAERDHYDKAMTPKPTGKAINTKAILEFICDEVTRQGWDLATEDGFRRVMWMIDAWDYALMWQDEAFCEEHLLAIAGIVEKVKNQKGYRAVGVRVGSRICPQAKEVPELIKRLFENRHSLTPDEFYVRFQEVHPFVDGNGRTGKILHNWLLGTLHNPVLIKDYFGGGNP
ncbi:MAG: Fic family protein, partial [Candidatus Brocadiales bacterium]|nr:Fic family protein [Candidatus Bathyanammoxibius sp.]